MSIEEIPYRFPISNRTSIIDSEELTALELVGRTTEKVNEVITQVNTQQADIDSREKSDDITNNRKLSPTGNFTGTINGLSVADAVKNVVQADIDSREKSVDITNNRKLSPSGDFTGSWFGISNPALADPGIAGSVVQLQTDVSNQMSKTNFYELNNMKNNRVMPLTFNSDLGHLNTFTGDKAVNGIMETDTAGNSGFVVTKADIYTAFLKLNMPIGVMIGDSIIAGHPALSSQLEAGLTPSIEEPGMMEYHIEEYAKIKVYNHGIGGERLDQFRDRWSRDVLAQENLSLTPSSTLPKKPIFVIIGTAINDVFLPRTSADMITDIEYMIDDAIDNNIYPIVINCGPHELMDSTKLAVVKEYNDWLVKKEKETPNLTVIDFYSFANDPNNDGKPLAGLFADGVHPTKVTYQRLTKKIIDEAMNEFKPPTIPAYLNISTAINLTNGSTAIWRPVGVLLSINDKPRKFVQLKNTPYQVIKLPAVDEVIDTITLRPFVAEAPAEMTDNIYNNIYFSEVYLSDRNLYPSNLVDKECNIDEVPAVNGINSFYPVIPDTSTPGQFTFTQTANDVNWTGVFAETTANNLGYVFNRGIGVIKNAEPMFKGDYIAVSTTGNFTRSPIPPTASIKGKVLIPNDTACLVEFF